LLFLEGEWDLSGSRSLFLFNVGVWNIDGSLSWDSDVVNDGVIDDADIIRRVSRDVEIIRGSITSIEGDIIFRCDFRWVSFPVSSVLSGKSECGSGGRVSTKLASLDVCDVVGKIIFDIRVSSRVKAKISGLSTGVDTITGVIRVSDGSGDLSLSLLNVKVVLGNLSSSGFGDWDREGEVFVSGSGLGDSDGVSSWDLSGSSSLDCFLYGDSSGLS
jgi:hypothetical protein